MARPMKETEDLKRNLVKGYLTDYELELLYEVCEAMNCSVSRAIVSGVYASLTLIKNAEKEY